MNTTHKRNRTRKADEPLHSSYAAPVTGDESRLFDHIKSDLTFLISDQIKKKAKNEFSLSLLDKKFQHLQMLSKEIDELIKTEESNLEQEKSTVQNCIGFNQSNLHYLQVKYESALTNLRNTKCSMDEMIEKSIEADLAAYAQSVRLLLSKRDHCNSLKAEIVGAREQVLPITARAQGTTETLEESERSLETIEVKYHVLLQTHKKKLAAYTKIKDEYSRQLIIKRQARENVTNLEKETEALNAVLQNLNEERESLAATLDSTLERNDNLLAVTKDENNLLLEQSRELKEKLERNEEGIKTLEQQKQTMDKEYRIQEEKLKEVMALYETERRKDMEAMDSVKALGDEYNGLVHKLQSQESEVSALNRSNKSLKQKQEMAQDELNELLGKLQKMSSKVEESLSLIEKRKGELEKLKKQRKNNEQFRAQLEQEISNLEEAFQNEQHFNSRLNKLIIASHVCYDKLEEIEKSQTSLDGKRYAETYLQLEKEKESIQGKHDEKKAHLAQQLNEENALKAEVLGQKKLMEERQKEIEEIRQQTERIAKEIEGGTCDYNERKRRMEEEIEEVKKEYADRIKELQGSLDNQMILDQYEHEIFIREAEKEKQEYEFNLFKTELKTEMDQKMETLKTTVREMESKIKEHKMKYSELKSGA